MDAGRRERYERDGIFVNGARAYFSYVTPEEARPVDLIIIATKNAHLPAVIEEIRPAVGEHTMILSLLNGIQSESDLAAAFGAGHVLYGFIVGLSAICRLPYAGFKSPVMQDLVRTVVQLGKKHGIPTPACALLEQLVEAAELSSLARLGRG